MRIALRSLLFLSNALLINFSFLLAFFLRYGLPFPERNFTSYENNFAFLTLTYMIMLAAFGVYKSRFESSWDLFKRVFLGLLLGTLLNVTLVYVFRTRWGSLPTTIFVISLLVNLLLIFKFNQLALRACRRIRKKVLVIGEGSIEDIIIGKAEIERIPVERTANLAEYTDIDEMIICEIPEERGMGLITFIAQKLKVDVLFSPACYAKLLPERINGAHSTPSLVTFISRKREAEELAMRGLDILGSILILMVSLPVTMVVALLIKLDSEGPVFYKQERVGKDGKCFMLYKFRTMVNDAEKQLGPVWAAKNDPRVTKIGKLLRETRLDEFPQLLNVLRGQMSLVGPRPERPFFVKRHKVLMTIRLAVKPGLTGLAQIRNSYDLHPKHKIKYDYLYIQRRSLFLNLYVLAKTLPVMLLKKGQ